MNRSMLGLAGLAALAAALTTAPEPARADNLAHADRWMAKRFQRAFPPPERRRARVQETRQRLSRR